MHVFLEIPAGAMMTCKSERPYSVVCVGCSSNFAVLCSRSRAGLRLKFQHSFYLHQSHNFLVNDLFIWSQTTRRFVRAI